MANTACTQFDEVDTYYLANNLTAPKLRRELRCAEIKVAVDDAFQGTEFQNDAPFPWLDYAQCCQEAIVWQRSTKPTTKTMPRHIDTEAIKTRNDIVAVISGYTKLRKAGKNFTGCCPIHNEKHPSLTVYPDNQTWHCYGCNRGGDIFSFIQEIEHTDFRGAAAILGDK